MNIINRFTNSVIFASGHKTMAATVKAALKDGANLSRANLSGANLSRADLFRADLSEANLSRADLSWANLSGANLSWADLSEANLSKASGIIDGGQDARGYRFIGYFYKEWRIKAGCRDFTLQEAIDHWTTAHSDNQALNLDCILRVKTIVALAKMQPEGPKTN